MVDDIAYNPNDTADERIKALEREKKGIISDLQSERDRRQQLEQRLSSLETRIPVGPTPTAEEKVNRLAQNPDEYIDQRVNQRFIEMQREVGQLKFKSAVDEAYDWLAEQEGTTPRKLKNSPFDDNLARIIKEHNLNSLDPISGAKTAYKIHLREKDEKESAEKERSKAITGNATERSAGRPINNNGFKFSAKQIAAMSQKEFDANFDAIQEAKQNGQISTT